MSEKNEKNEVKANNASIARNAKKENRVRVTITSGDWPVHLLNEWEEDCKQNYNDIRWVKMYQDHKSARTLDNIVDLLASIKKEVEVLNARIESLENPEKREDENEGVALMGNSKGES